MNRKHLAVSILIMVAFLMILPASASAAHSGNQISGIDVSVWQGDIDFERVKASGIDSVYIRACEGVNIKDRYFERNYEKARESGLKYGFYHYVTARSAEEAEEQADFFASLIKTKPCDMRAVMDFENLSGLTAGESVNIAEHYLERLSEHLGYTPALYSDAYDAASIWKSHLKRYPLWVADYGVREPYSIGGWPYWSGFQYDDKGKVPGISGHVDLDYFKGAIFLTEREQDSAKQVRHDYSRSNDGCDCEK